MNKCCMLRYVLWIRSWLMTRSKAAGIFFGRKIIGQKDADHFPASIGPITIFLPFHISAITLP